MVNMGRGLQIASPHHPPCLPLLLNESFNCLHRDNLVSGTVNIKLWA